MKSTLNRIEFMINRERIRYLGKASENGDLFVEVYDTVRGLSLVKGDIDQGQKYLGYLMNPDAAFNDVLSKPFEGKSMEQLAQEGLATMSAMASVPTVVHYGYYSQQYDQYKSDPNVGQVESYE